MDTWGGHAVTTLRCCTFSKLANGLPCARRHRAAGRAVGHHRVAMRFQNLPFTAPSPNHHASNCTHFQTADIWTACHSRDNSGVILASPMGPQFTMRTRHDGPPLERTPRGCVNERRCKFESLRDN